MLVVIRHFKRFAPPETHQQEPQRADSSSSAGLNAARHRRYHTHLQSSAFTPRRAFTQLSILEVFEYSICDSERGLSIFQGLTHAEHINLELF